MPQAMMNDYRARKVEEELFSKQSFSKPCELVLKHGNANYSYWGTPEVIAVSPKTIAGKSMSMISLIWKTKRDVPAYVTLPLREGKTLENVMTPCSYMQTDRGYRNVIMTVIAGLILLNGVDFYVALSMATVGAEAFSSPVFTVPISMVVASIMTSLLYNKTHFTHRLSVECMRADKEFGLYHFCYAVDCAVPVTDQLWFENVPELAAAAIDEHSKRLGRYVLDLRTQCGERNEEVNEILMDRAHEGAQRRDRAALMHDSPSFWESPMAFAVVVIACVSIAAVVWLLARGGI